MAEEYIGYCMKCKKKVKIKNPKIYINKRGIRAVKGVCPHTGTAVHRILGKKK